MTPNVDRIALPVVPAPPRRTGVPIVATVAPLGLAVALWLGTGSPYALLVGLLGPLMAVGTLVDGRRAARRSRRKAVAEARQELERIGADVADRLATRAAQLRAAAPEPDELVLATGRRGWRVGTGPVPSGIEFAGEVPTELADEIERLRASCAEIAEAPLVVDDGEEFAVLGVEPLVRAFARGLVLQAVARCPVGTARVEAPDGEAWADELPAPVAAGPDWSVSSDGSVVLRIRGVSEGSAARRVEFPADGSAPRLDGAPGEWTPALLSAPEAAHIASRLTDAARAAGWRAAGDLPREVALGELLDGAAGAESAACVGVDDAGVVLVDLEHDGPHALVAGTTGSGKSELLVTWVLALAARRPPAELAFLLVDFKGGAAFAPLHALPHVVGVVSDLDETLAARAVQSLRAELRRREAVLAGHGARDVAELPAGALPRLYVVVDEFAALVGADAELHAVFTDLAARGRSLGMHLLLGTQRPAGVVRDALLANVTVRACLRVLEPGESTATVGVPDAAAIDADARGRAVLADGSGRRLVQVALADAVLVDRVVERWRDAPVPAARPWVDPLPAVLPLTAVPRGAVGLVDRPELQRREPLVLDPWRAGAVLVLGGAASGRTGALATLAAVAREHARAEVRWVAGEPAELWQAITTPSKAPVLVIADDLDAQLARGDPEQRAELAELIARAAREGGRRGLAVAASARGAGGALLTAAAAFEQRVLLRLPNREEHLLAGGEGRGYRVDRGPGSGLWHGHEVQFALDSGTPAAWRAALEAVRPAGGGWGVVTSRPTTWLARLDAAGVRAASVDRPDADPADVLVGDPDGWLAAHPALTGIRRSGRLLLHGCARADHRLLTRSREPLPPLGGDDEAWLLEDGATRRVRIGGTDVRPA
ncbi:hypothetical protein H4J02_05965 [Protaetiibacter sp. SSC-01]|uniref:FtsK/SpoIIIE domain-containing protein n=1 Tax=Protaetiibacter sp. SSC-01 TaxID=2759943 RepID=UPI001656C72E|nr:FtsK/SpoIIIE domain-containing protein [Protaetiibacter sp. SSC-01]QNO38545.1 hypothetical protein H4J02_05965 [Protaetiibacter sp. SSC-01]